MPGREVPHRHALSLEEDGFGLQLFTFQLVAVNWLGRTQMRALNSVF